MVLGIRCSNSDFSYAVLSGSKDAPTLEYEGSNKIPRNYSKPRALSWFVQEVEEIITRHEIKKIVMKGFEGQVKTKTYEERVELETAVYIAASKFGLNAVFKKVSSTIAKDLGLKGKKHYLTTQLDTSVIPNFAEKSEIRREAIFAAWSEL